MIGLKFSESQNIANIRPKIVTLINNGFLLLNRITHLVLVREILLQETERVQQNYFQEDLTQNFSAY